MTVKDLIGLFGSGNTDLPVYVGGWYNRNGLVEHKIEKDDGRVTILKDRVVITAEPLDRKDLNDSRNTNVDVCGDVGTPSEDNNGS